MTVAALAIREVTICRSRQPVVSKVSCAFELGSFVGILGANGAGKTSLMQAILGWLPLSSGEITIDGKPARKSLSRVSYLSQRQSVDLDFPITVRDLVTMGRYQERGFARAFTARDHEIVATAVAEMGLEALVAAPLSRLSGGQVQRAFLARALATGADIFLLDEPLAGLDATTTDDLLCRLTRWAARGRLIVAVIHDLGLAERFCSHLVMLNHHLVAAGPTSSVYTLEHLVATFGPEILRSLSRGVAPAHE
jgi:manganese/zinc/iron transport system ATP- binding protein